MSMWTSLILGLGALSGVRAAFAEDVFFIVRHGQLVATRLDPIMSPGAVSGHVHAIVGGSNFGPVYDYDRSIESQCTTANIDNDHSNYWVPQLYNKHANGTFSLAGLSYVNTYYQMRRTGDEPVYEFPPGFRMLAGDQNRKTLDVNDPAQDAVRYVCLGGSTPEGHEFPAERCNDGLRAQVYFPHCWDGINSWLEGSRHVSYGEGRFDGGGQCPPTHPKRIMGLFYEFIFHDHEEYRAGGRVWSNGDDTGYALHADFTNGWPVGFFSEIFSYGKACSVGFSVENCPALAPHLVDDQKCAYTGVKVDEDIGDQGAIAKLPGNNPPTAGYQESAGFNSGSPSPTQITSVPATSIVMGTVKGDSPQSAPPDAIPQSGQASSPSAAPTASAASPASSGAAAASSAPASALASASASATELTASSSAALPGGGGVLIGGPAVSASVSDSFSSSFGSSSAAAAPTTSASSGTLSSSASPSVSARESAGSASASTALDIASTSVSASASTGRPSGARTCGRKKRRAL